MKKKIYAVLLMLFLLLNSVVPVFAIETEELVNEKCRVVDMANLLTDSEKNTIIEKFDEVSIRQKTDIIVATTEDLQNYSVRDYADALYDDYNFGYGSNRDGVLLLISMEDKDCYISTCGYGSTAFTDAGIEYIGKQIKTELSDGDYAEAFEEFAELSDDFITQARSGEPYDSGNLPKKPMSVIWIPISIVIGFLIAKIIVGQMKDKLKTVRSKSEANDYIKNGSMNIVESRDLFLYHTVVKTAKPKNNNSSGSRTHTSASGQTHGGGGGKF